ncbi:MAG: acetyl-CoA hydrolase/transferase family protein [Cytophagales bacterium]
MKITSAAEAVKIIENGYNIFVHTAAATPERLLIAMTDRAPELKNVHLYHMHIEGSAPHVAPEYEGIFHDHSFFVGANVRKAVQLGRADYIPLFYSEIPHVIRKKVIPIDVAFIHVSPPDKHGYCSLGVSVEATLSAVQNAKYVIAQINPNMPRTHGDGLIHIDHIYAGIEVNDAIHETKAAEPTEVELQIGQHVASLVEDGATLQMGIGAIPNAVLKFLTGHKGLGVHTEMFSDGVMDLVKSGTITGEHKRTHPGKIVSGFVVGTRKLYDFIDDNPEVAMLDIAYVNDTAVIRRNPKVTAINSAVEVDLMGQVCADSIGMMQFSGVGGQMDFIRGASLSDGGKPIIALPSITPKGISKIVNFLKTGANVVTTRAHVQYVVTEYGIAYLYAKNLKERAKALINIAHPSFREQLEKEATHVLGRL